MRVLIAYSTKGGAARECAEILSAEIGDCTVCDLNDKTPNVADYDMVIMGSGIRMGGAYKPFKKFIEKNSSALMSKKIAFFICNKQTGKYRTFVDKNIPDELRNAAICIDTFGGKPPFGKVTDQSWMLKQEIEAFARIIKGSA
ncbi:MAG: hypothetical protein FWD92_00290 [Methanomassiliicoccaceae archaeon]|nr:hypothetical protein [Methanomassiliicoccaceae archaeon]